MPQPQTLLCTVGTSLFFPNLDSLGKQLAANTIAADLRPLAEAYRDRDWPTVANQLAQRDAAERLCGAEINSITSLIKHGHVPTNVGLFFFHSATPDGQHIAAILKHFYEQHGHSPVRAIEIEDLQDQDAKRFRTKGLRNLARHLCATVRDYHAPTCAINATGGYKAQIAIAVLLGQALGLPVYYMHERFTEIIAFPPLPVALDFEVWMRATGLLSALERDTLVPRAEFEEEWDERYESLVNTETVDGVEYLELSATGQIFHETFRERFRSQRDQVLPPAAAKGRKQEPNLKSDEGHLLAYRAEIERYLRKVTAEVPQVVLCTTSYFNPDLPQKKRFREARGTIEGIYSDGKFTVKFRIETTAQTDGQRAAVVAALNDWLGGQA